MSLIVDELQIMNEEAPFLPLEILMHLMGFLEYIDRKAAGQVSYLWNIASVSPRFCMLEKLTINRMTPSEVVQIVHIFEGTRRPFFNMSLVENDMTEYWPEFWEFFGPKIKSLSIYCCTLEEEVFVHLLKHCTALESLEIVSCPSLFMDGHLLENEEDRFTLRERLPTVNCLQLSFNSYLCDQLLDRLLFIMPSITSLTLDSCPLQCHKGLIKRFYPSGWRHRVFSESILTITYLVKYLETRGKEFKSLNLNSTVIDSHSLLKLVTTANLSLKDLSLMSCRQLTDTGLNAIGLHQKNLQTLHLSNCSRISNEAIYTLCKELTLLKEFTLSECDNISDQGISGLHQLSNLERLNLHLCKKITEEGLKSGIFCRTNSHLSHLSIKAPEEIISEVLRSIPRCFPNLVHLALFDCSGLMDDATFQHIIPGITCLQSLELKDNKKLTDVGLIGNGTLSEPSDTSNNQIECSSMPANISIKSISGLHHLVISGNKSITDRTLIEGIRFLDLQTLILCGCTEISDSGIKAVSINNPRLEILKLADCSKITDDGVEALLQNLKYLSQLNLKSCQLLTSKTLDMALKFGSNLSYINISFCPLIKDSEHFNSIKTGIKRANITRLKPLFYSK